ncbi:MAG: hypothetical protein JSR37_08660, partial [Verrucomicrobia bacterium]|nr:hypothetical protein [Verrucomicrobiota bacterium]
MQYEWTVKATDANVSLLQFIQKKLPDYSMRKIKGWIDAGYCFVAARQQRFARTAVLAGQKITLNVVEQKIEEIAYIYEDEAILVIDKPAGITCDERLVKSLAKANKQVILVHRLDKETTGLLLLAKSEDIKKYFIEEFRNLAVEKSYVAIVDGVIEKPSGHIENYLGP